MANKLEAMIQRLMNEENSRKKAEARNIFSEQRLAAAIKAGNLGVWEWDIHNNSLIWDKTMYQLYGKDENVPVENAQSWEEAVLDEDRKIAVADTREALEGSGEYKTEFRVRWPDGSIHHLKAFGTIIRDKNGNPTHILGMNYDVTEIRQKEKEIETLKKASENNH
jgi:PAS domain S-box-containing protein